MDDVRFLPSGNVLVAANVDLAGEISISADTESVLGHRDLQDFFGDDPYWVRPRVTYEKRCQGKSLPLRPGSLGVSMD